MSKQWLSGFSILFYFEINCAVFRLGSNIRGRLINEASERELPKAYAIEAGFRPLIGFANVAGDYLGRLVPCVAQYAIGRHVARRRRGRITGT